MRRYLVVANRTLLGEHLLERIDQCRAAGDSRFHLLVPASPPEDGLVFTEGRARAEAQARLDEALAALKARGADVTGEVGDRDPVNAVRDVLLEDDGFDEVILSTLPPRLSKWLGQDVPHRLARAVSIPVTHVTPDLAGV